MPIECILEYWFPMPKALAGPTPNEARGGYPLGAPPMLLIESDCNTM